MIFNIGGCNAENLWTKITESLPNHFLLAGCGNIAPKHIAQINRIGILKAVCDIDKEKADSIANANNAHSYTALDAMLNAEEADILVIATPNGIHAQQAIIALEKGLHVLCEKPMSIHAADAHRMMDAAGKMNRQLMIIKQNRYNAPIQELKKWISSGRSGRVFSFQLTCLWNRNEDYYKQASWRGTKKWDGGILYTQFSHYIDFVYWLFGEAESIQSMNSNVHHQDQLEFADQGIVNLRFASGVLGNIHFSINGYKHNLESSLTVLAENGSIRIGGLSCNQVDYQSVKGENFTNTNSNAAINQYKAYSGSVSNHAFVYDHFIHCLETNKYDSQSLFEAMKTVDLIERIYAAA
ncbi:MAG: Gfo/Idh/MocA family oxidoreductase [Saprospiraceae bacterium]